MGDLEQILQLKVNCMQLFEFCPVRHKAIFPVAV